MRKKWYSVEEVQAFVVELELELIRLKRACEEASKREIDKLHVVETPVRRVKTFAGQCLTQALGQFTSEKEDPAATE